MLFFLIACASTIDLDAPDTADTGTEQPEPAPDSEETYLCASGGQVSHSHAMQTPVWPGVTDAELWTVYDDGYLTAEAAELGYEPAAVTVTLDVALDAEGRVLVVCEWADTDAYTGHVQASHALVVRH
ncbi:MAG: hypothetical protein ACEQSX_14150 [Baekduiaceae bacterium]